MNIVYTGAYPELSERGFQHTIIRIPTAGVWGLCLQPLRDFESLKPSKPNRLVFLVNNYNKFTDLELCALYSLTISKPCSVM